MIFKDKLNLTFTIVCTKSISGKEQIFIKGKSECLWIFPIAFGQSSLEEGDKTQNRRT